MIYCLETYGKQVLGIGPQDISFSTSKLFFAYGLGNALYFPFGVGAMTVLMSEKPTVERIFATLRRYRPTIFFAVPSVYASILHEARGSKLDFASVRRAISAGEALPAPLWTEFRAKFGVSIIDGIGSTEMLHMFISNRPDDTVPGSSGRPVPGYKVKIVNERGKAVAAGEMGELWVSGGSSAKSYWRRPHLTRSTFRGKWTSTGDKYIQDERGYFWHCGRSDDMLKVSGLWVSPLQIETALLAHPDVLECAAVGASDSDGLTKPKAFVVLKATSRSPVEAETRILAFLRSRLAGYMVPKWIVLVESLPRTATGKLQRFKLRDQTPLPFASRA
jgi:benzoate-CoA ligase